MKEPTLEFLYGLIGELYAANAILGERIKELTPAPPETEVGIVHLTREPLP